LLHLLQTQGMLAGIKNSGNRVLAMPAGMPANAGAIAQKSNLAAPAGAVTKPLVH